MRATTSIQDSEQAPCEILVPSEKLKDQIKSMVRAQEDWIPDADGIDRTKFIVLNDFSDGVWLCQHHGEANAAQFTRVQKLA